MQTKFTIVPMLCTSLLMLSACGSEGNNGGIASTPNPVGQQSPSYKTVSQLSGDRTYQTAGVTTNFVGFNGTSTSNNFGSGVTVRYTEATDSYELTAPDGTTTTVNPANLAVAGPINTLHWSKVEGTHVDDVTLNVPLGLGGVALSYTLVGTWARTTPSTGSQTVQFIVGGVPTLASDMPRTGTATYGVLLGGTARSATGNNISYSLAGTGTATFSANFATGEISTKLSLLGTPTNPPGLMTNFGSFVGTGTITSGGPGFSGKFDNDQGVFSGAFFGPQAAEVGYNWNINTPIFQAFGVVVGKKN